MKPQTTTLTVVAQVKRNFKMPNWTLSLAVAGSFLLLANCGPLRVTNDPRAFAAGPGFLSVSREASNLAPMGINLPSTISPAYMAYWQQTQSLTSRLDVCSYSGYCDKLFFAGELDRILQVTDAPVVPGITPLLRQIDLGKNITDVASSVIEDGGYVFASHQYAGGISVILPGSEKLYKFWSSDAVPQPGALSVHKDWGFVLSGSVLALFHVASTNADTFDLGGNPQHLSDGFAGIVGVTDFSANLVHLVTTAGVWGDNTVSMPSPGQIVLSQYQPLAFVASVPDTVNGVTPPNSIYVINTETGAIVKTIKVGNCISSLKLFLSGDYVYADPSTFSDDALLVANQCDSTITKIDLSSFQVSGTYSAPGQVHVLAIEP